MLESMSSTAPAPFASTCKDSLGDLNFGSLEQAIEGWEEGIGELGPHYSVETFMDEFGQEQTEAPEDPVPSGVAGGDCPTTKSYLDLLPDTCTSAGMSSAGGGCSFQIPLDDILGTPELTLQLAIGTCPASLLPFFSVRLGGAGATKFFAPCSSDGECGTGQACFDLAGVATNTGNVYNEMAQAFLEVMQYAGDMDAAMTSITAQDIGSTLMTTIRSFYDSVDITLGPDQLFPICLPQGGATGLFDWDPTGGSCEARFGTREEPDPSGSGEMIEVANPVECYELSTEAFWDAGRRRMQDAAVAPCFRGGCDEGMANGATDAGSCAAAGAQCVFDANADPNMGESMCAGPQACPTVTAAMGAAMMASADPNTFMMNADGSMNLAEPTVAAMYQCNFQCQMPDDTTCSAEIAGMVANDGAGMNAVRCH